MRTLLGASVKMVVRDHQAIFWALMFPMILLGVFRLFSPGAGETSDVLLVADTQTRAGAAVAQALQQVSFLHVSVQPGLSEDQALAELRANRADVALILGAAPANQSAPLTLLDAIRDPVSAAVTEAAIRSVVDGTNLALTGVPRAVQLQPRPSGVERATFFQFVAPGILGMGLMTFATISLAGSLSRYREEGVLRRIRATPLAPWRFFSAVLGAHVLVSVMQVLVLAVMAQLLGAHIFNGGIGLIVVAVYGTMIFLNIGVAIAGRVHGRGAVEGAANAVTLPMMFLSGSFFPVTSLPAAIRPVVEALPLTHMLQAMRALALNGESLWQQWPALAVLTAWLLVTLLLARLSFSFADA